MHTSDDMEYHYQGCTTAQEARVRSNSLAYGTQASTVARSVRGRSCAHIAAVQKELDTTETVPMQLGDLNGDREQVCALA